jgi:hypothetical protein
MIAIYNAASALGDAFQGTHRSRISTTSRASVSVMPTADLVHAALPVEASSKFPRWPDALIPLHHPTRKDVDEDVSREQAKSVSSCRRRAIDMIEELAFWTWLVVRQRDRRDYTSVGRVGESW